MSNAAFVLLSLIAFRLCGQSTTAPVPSPQQNEGSFSVDVNLVMLRATVLDKKGGFVSGLQIDNFQVLEDGKPQKIQYFNSGDVPVAVGLIVDNSGSMRPKRADVTAAAEAFVKASNPQDQMFIINFNERTSLGLGDTQLFSANVGELERALNGVPASGRTALYDAIERGFEHLQKTTLDKKVLIVISDGGDNASSHTLAQVLNTAERSEAMVYTIGLFDENDEDRNPGVLKKIARATGGEVFLPKKIGKVVEICEQIARDIRNQYSIGYLPANQNFNNTYRSIQVTANAPHHGKCVVRTRSGYIASREQEKPR